MKEIKHNCPKKMYFDDKAGKCVIDGENLNEYREDEKRGIPRSLVRTKKVL